MGSGQSYEKLAKRNASFFGGGSLVNPDAPQQIVKRAKAFATGKADAPKRRRRSKKKK